MTSAQTMLGRLGFAARWLIAALPAGILWSGGCAAKPELTPPSVLAAPYDTTQGDVLWAVAPLRNESGASIADPLAVSDKVVAAAAQVRGVRVVPINRTLAAMRALEITGITTPDDARRLAAEMGVDGLIVGSVTAWDPYNPPTLGLSLALYARPGAMDQRGSRPVDTREFAYQPVEVDPFPRSGYADGPASVVSEHLDGKNHQVLMDLQSFAAGRHEPDTALGWKRYLASMDLYTEFAAWHAVGRLLDGEWLRLARAGCED